MSPARAFARHQPRRAFALPMVVIVALIGGLAVAVMLERSGIGHAAVQREIRTYQDHHRNLSMQLAVQRWLSSSRDLLADRIAVDGAEFTMAFSGGRVMRVDIENAQGAVLRNFDSLSVRERDLARRVVAQLEMLLPPAEDRTDDQRDFRTEGPLAVSANAAEPEVFLAIAAAVCSEGNPQFFAERMVSLRNDHTLDEADIRNACEEARMSQEETMRVQALITSGPPQLWRAIGEVDRTGGLTGLAYRAGGLFEVTVERGGISGVNQTPAFLGWEDLPLDDEWSATGGRQ